MLEQRSDWITEVGDESFAEEVLEASCERPVLVDFWAAWCGPCRMLTPVLEKLAVEFEGAFKLAKINTEEAPALASQFGVQSIPLVLLFRNREPVDKFLGALPESEIRSFLGEHCTTALDELVVAGHESMDKGDLEGARRFFEEARAAEQLHAGALVGLAKVSWEAGQFQEVEQYLNAVDPLSAEAEEVEILRARLRFRDQAEGFGGLAACRKRAGDDPDDLESQYQLGCCLVADRQYREALECFLNVVARDRSFGDESPRKAMLDVFKMVGNRSSLSEEYRTRLSRLIF